MAPKSALIHFYTWTYDCTKAPSWNLSTEGGVMDVGGVINVHREEKWVRCLTQKERLRRIKTRLWCHK